MQRLSNLPSDTQLTFGKALGVSLTHSVMLLLNAAVLQHVTPGILASSAPPLSAVLYLD